MSEYEFTEKQNQIFAALSVSLRQFGIQVGVFAVMLISLGLVVAFHNNVQFRDAYTDVAGGLGMILVGALTLALCFRLEKPVSAFRQIITTQSQDIGRLMLGLEELARAYRLFRVILALLLIGVAFGVFRVLQ
jgi:hypothetical protein